MTIELPDEVHARVRELARASGRLSEAVLTEVIGRYLSGIAGCGPRSTKGGAPPTRDR